MRPSLVLDFAKTKRLDRRITFTRADTTSGIATYFGSDGYLKYATKDEPRFDHDPVTGISKGLLIENAATNYCTYSNTFANAAWQVLGTGTKTDNTATSVTGTSSAATITNTSGYEVYQDIFAAIGATTPAAASVFLKAGTTSNVQIYQTRKNGAVSETSTLDINLTLGTGTGGSVIDVGNGWYRCSVALVGTDVANNTLRFGIKPLAAGSIYVFGAQIEAGVYNESSYVVTAAAATVRGSDIASISGTNFSSIFNQKEGTIIVSFRNSSLLTMPGANIDRGIWCIDDTGTTQRICAYTLDNANVYTEIVKDSGNQFVISGYPYSAYGTLVCSAFAWKENNSSLAVYGSETVDTAVVLPTVTMQILRIGRNRPTVDKCLDGTLSKLVYYPKRLDSQYIRSLSLAPPVSVMPSFEFDLQQSKFIPKSFKFTGVADNNNVGSYYGSNGLLKWQTTDTLPIDHDPVTRQCKGLLIEESRTNMILHHYNFTNGINGWSSNCTQTQGIADPFGGTNATTLTDNDGVSYQGIWSNLFAGTYSGQKICNSIFVKKDNVGRATRNCILRTVFYGGAATQNCDIAIDTATGEILPTLPALTTTIGYGTIDCGDWWRVWFSCSSSDATNVNASMYFYPASGTGWTFSTSVTGSVTVFGAQFEVGAFPTSLIKSVGTAVTRPQSYLNTTTLSSWFNQNEGTFVVGFDQIGLDATTRIFTVSNAATNTASIRYNSAGYIYGTVNATSIPASGRTAKLNKKQLATFAYNASTALCCDNGAGGVSTSATFPTTVNAVRFGANYDGTDPFSGHIYSFKYYIKKLDSTES
jgi:hypothetical protein